MPLPDYEPKSVRYAGLYRDDGVAVNPADIMQPSGGGDLEITLVNSDARTLHADTPCKWVYLQNGYESGNLKWGFSASPKLVLLPGGMAPPISVENLNKIYVQGAANDKVLVGYQG